MLDIKEVRSNPERVKQAMKARGMDADAIVDKMLQIDEDRREIIQKADAMKAEQNADSKKIPQVKKEGGDVSALMARLKALSDEIKGQDAQLAALEEQQKDLLLSLPNIAHESVPAGRDDTENQEVRRWGNPPAFGFEPKAHWDIGKDLDILDPETAAKVTGARFHFYKGLGARLERAVVNFYLNTHGERGYTEILPPFIVNRASMTGTGLYVYLLEDAFRLATKVSNEDYFLIPTAEVPVTNMYRGDILEGAKLPLKYCAYSACFRAEAGSAGRDTRGLIRQHQFNKVELVKFVHPDHSYDELEALTRRRRICLAAAWASVPRGMPVYGRSGLFLGQNLRY